MDVFSGGEVDDHVVVLFFSDDVLGDVSCLSESGVAFGEVHYDFAAVVVVCHVVGEVWGWEVCGDVKPVLHIKRFGIFLL